MRQSPSIPGMPWLAPMSNSRKKVLVRRFSGDTLPGYLAPSGFVRNSSIDLLDLSGRILPLPLNDIKTVSYVRDFNLSDPVNPERLTRRAFLARPRSRRPLAPPHLPLRRPA